MIDQLMQPSVGSGGCGGKRSENLILSVQREYMGITLGINEGVLQWCLCEVAELLLLVAPGTWNWTNCSEPASQYCFFWDRWEGISAACTRGHCTPS